MSTPITVLERKPVETELVEREYTYEELLEMFPDGGESIVNPLVRRCQEYEAEIEQLQNENQRRCVEEKMMKLLSANAEIDRLHKVIDGILESKRYADDVVAEQYITIQQLTAENEKLWNELAVYKHREEQQQQWLDRMFKQREEYLCYFYGET